MLGAQPAPADAPPPDLIASRPTSNVEGLLERRYLTPGERVLYEARPSFVGAVLWVFIAEVVILVLLALGILVLNVLAGSSSGPAFPWGPFLELFGVLIVIVSIATVVRWWYTVYAITDRRTLVKEGMLSRRVIDVPSASVQSVLLEESAFGRLFGYGTVQYSSASVAGFSLTLLGSRPGVVNWRDAPQPVETRAFFELVKGATSPG